MILLPLRHWPLCIMIKWHNDFWIRNKFLTQASTAKHMWQAKTGSSSLELYCLYAFHSFSQVRRIINSIIYFHYILWHLILLKAIVSSQGNKSAHRFILIQVCIHSLQIQKIVGIHSTQRRSNRVNVNKPDSDSDNFIDPKKGNSFAAYPVHAHHSKTHRQGSYMSE